MPRRNEIEPGSIGYRIRQLREDLDLSQEALAKKVHSSKNIVSRIESGKQDLYSCQIQDYAKALNTSAYYLITGIHPVNSNIAEELDLTDFTVEFLRKAKNDSRDTEGEETVFFINEFKYVFDVLAHNPKFTLDLFHYISDTFSNFLVEEYSSNSHHRERYVLSVKNIVNFPADSLEQIYRLQILDGLKIIRDSFAPIRNKIQNDIADLIENMASDSSADDLPGKAFEELTDKDMHAIFITGVKEGAKKDNGKS